MAPRSVPALVLQVQLKRNSTSLQSKHVSKAFPTLSNLNCPSSLLMQRLRSIVAGPGTRLTVAQSARKIEPCNSVLKQTTSLIRRTSWREVIECDNALQRLKKGKKKIVLDGMVQWSCRLAMFELSNCYLGSIALDYILSNIPNFGSNETNHPELADSN